MLADHYSDAFLNLNRDSRKGESGMTDEERQELVDELRRPTKRHEGYYDPLCAQAADEIEQLAAEVQDWKNINGELNHQLHLWKSGSQFSGSSPNPPREHKMTDKERRRWEAHGMNANTYRGLLLDRLITEEREYRYTSGFSYFDAKKSLLVIIALRQELARLGEQL